MTEIIKPKSGYRTDDPKPGPNDTQGVMGIWYWKNRPLKGTGFKQFYTGQKVPPEFITASNPPKFCDKYALEERLYGLIEKKKGLWDIVEIIDIATDIKLEQHYWSNGIHRKKIFNAYEWELISHRDQRYKIKVIAPPPIIKKHFSRS